jgi:hypothetical protein
MIGGVPILDGNMSNGLLINSTGTSFYSRHFSISAGKYFAVSVSCTGTGGIPSLTLKLEQSWAMPSYEGTADSQWTTPVGMPDLYTNMITSALQIIPFSPAALRFARIKATPSVGSPTNMTLYGAVHIFEDVDHF